MARGNQCSHAAATENLSEEVKSRFVIALLWAFPVSSFLPAVEVTKVTASNSQAGNGAANAIDAHPGSRWASNGKGQWLQLELDQVAKFSEFEAGFTRGSRHYEFSVETSSDGKKWSKVFSGKSHGAG
ncbi:MAG: discoidin domain-containing protein, partial [Opitutales bacterium]